MANKDKYLLAFNFHVSFFGLNVYKVEKSKYFNFFFENWTQNLTFKCKTRHFYQLFNIYKKRYKNRV